MSDNRRNSEFEEVDERLGDLWSMSRAEQNLALRWAAWLVALIAIVVAASWLF